MLFLVVDGIPSEGQLVTVGNGVIGQQQVWDATVLPQSEVIAAADPEAHAAAGVDEDTAGAEAVANNQQLGSGAMALGPVLSAVAGLSLVSLLFI